MQKINTEDNNKGKEYSRQQIAVVINAVIKDRPINMLELLGAGIGAEYYCNNLVNLNKMHLVEYSKIKYEKWIDKDLESFCERISDNILLSSECCDVASVFEKETTEPFNVVNLDFCTHFYVSDKPNCTAYPIDSLLRNKKLEDNGLLLLTFMITGAGANFDKRAIKDKDSIIYCISQIAEFANWSIDEVVFSYTYKSSKPTTMLNLGLRMKYNGEKFGITT